MKILLMPEQTSREKDWKGDPVYKFRRIVLIDGNEIKTTFSKRAKPLSGKDWGTKEAHQW